MAQPRQRNGLRGARSEEFLDRGGRGGRSPSKSYSEANLLNNEAYYDDQFEHPLRRESPMKRGDLKYRSTEGYINHGLVEDERSHRSQSRLSRSQEPPRRLGASSRPPSQLSVSGRLSRQQKHLSNNIGPLSYRSDPPSPPLSQALMLITWLQARRSHPERQVFPQERLRRQPGQHC